MTDSLILIGQHGILGPFTRLLFQRESSGPSSAWFILALPLAIAVLWVLVRRWRG